MLRSTLIYGALVMMVSVAGGCRMCRHPFDYSGPVYHDGCNMPHQRAGSILSGADVVSEPMPAMPDELARRQPARPQPAVQTAQRTRSKPVSRTSSGASMARESRQAEVQQPPMSQAALRSKVAEDARPGDVPGSERIISVTEKVVDSTTDTVGEAVGSGETYATPQRASQGWTARRADAETVR